MDRTSLGFGARASEPETNRRRALVGFAAVVLATSFPRAARAQVAPDPPSVRIAAPARATIGRPFNLQMTTFAANGVELVELFRCAPTPGVPLEDRCTLIDQTGEPAFTFTVPATGRPGRIAFIARLTTAGGGAVDSNEVVVTLQKRKRKKGR